MYAAMPQPLIERRRNGGFLGPVPTVQRLPDPTSRACSGNVADRLSQQPGEHSGGLSSEQRALRLIIEQTAAHAFDIEPELLSFPSRGRARTALARQAAMYIAHVGLSFSLTQVGQLFDRDRTTVAHACEVVEQRRDDVAFDRAITLLERVIRIICAAPGQRSGVTVPPPSAWPVDANGGVS